VLSNIRRGTWVNYRHAREANKRGEPEDDPFETPADPLPHHLRKPTNIPQWFIPPYDNTDYGPPF
jgi:hypothetical protein